ncbi:MBL fold metallo-hydrolase [Indioceanicola profundi]|uniref:MBL fold metallo-hydrolase n=1 Tax=Indioceanicola profundi TaxID=2220096 RepID=UPI00298E5D26|nr:MBL fold metallo-hydrolase [Indioceanicola profundi]
MAEQSEFTVTFWGVRGSIASPGPATARYGGNTPCLEVRCADHLIILDAGTGIRALGEVLEERVVKGEGALKGDLFLTHTHYDHISGLPFFAPIYDKRNCFRMWEGHLGPDRTLEQIIRQLMSEPLFPVPLNLIAGSCRFTKFQAGETLDIHPGIIVRTAPLNHPNGATGYRIEQGGRSFCYITDTEHVPGRRDERIVELVRNADIMVYDATYSDAEYESHRGWGHSTWQEALRLADAAGVGQVVLFHHDPSHNDTIMDRVADEACRVRTGTLVAAEGMVLTL